MSSQAAAKRCVFGLIVAVLALALAGCTPQRAQGPAPLAPTAVPAVTTTPTQLPTPAANDSPLPSPAASDSPLATPDSRASQDTPDQALLHVLATPDKYVGKQVTVAGTLKAEGDMPNIRFFLVAQDGQKLEVTSWVPIEAIQPPKGGTAPKTMASFVDKQMQLTGTPEMQNGSLILVVSQAAEQ